MNDPTAATATGTPIGPAISPAAPRDATRVLLKVAPERIVDLHAILEGYDDLGVMRTLRPDAGLVEVWVSPGAEAEFATLRRALAAEGLPTEIAEE